MILPYLEQTTMYNACNFSVGNNEGANFWINSTVTLSRVNGFLCPSDPYAGSGAPTSATRIRATTIATSAVRAPRR